MRKDEDGWGIFLIAFALLIGVAFPIAVVIVIAHFVIKFW